MKSEVRLNIGRRTNNAKDKFIYLEIDDERSGTRLLQAKFTLEDFMRALTNLGDMPGVAELTHADLFGRDRQSKKFSITLQDMKYSDYKDRDRKIKEILKEECPKGWRVSTSLDRRDSVDIDYSTNTITVNTYITKFVKRKQR